MTADAQATRFEVTDDGVAVITLHRPEVRNAFNARMATELAECYRYCDETDAVRVVVLTGEPPAFCSGADLSRGADTFVGDQQGIDARALHVPAFRVRKPVIAAVNGHAIGVGFTMTLQCDLRIMALDARYGAVQVRRGVLGDAYAHWTLPRLVGHSAAAEILLTGATFDGRRALELGLCSRALPNDEVVPAAMELATDMARYGAPLSMAASKRILWTTWDLGAEAVADAESAAHGVVMRHPDAREAMQAYAERRRPRFTGSVSTDLD